MAPSWAVLWLLPWALVDGALSGVLAGLLFGGLKYGGSKIQDAVGAPTELISIVVGTIILFIAMPKLIQTLLKSRKG